MRDRAQNTVRVSFWTSSAGWRGSTRTDPAGTVDLEFVLISFVIIGLFLFIFVILLSFSLREGKEGLLTKTRRRLTDIIRTCFFEAGRSIAHKCSRFLALCIRWVCDIS